ncbi:uncharacterized protein [Aquarana catesbeiana]|uniref:uncharacterized protein n=1 Tax=Aquarana catesbeiana TaxID=8400 RepID=UPI003CC99DEA
MAQLYDDPQRTATAETLLHNLSQGRRPVEDYIVEFRKNSADTGWNEPALKYQFRQGLSEALKDELNFLLVTQGDLMSAIKSTSAQCSEPQVSSMEKRNLLPLNERVEWCDDYEEHLNRILDRNTDSEINTDFIVPVLVHAPGWMYDKEEYRIMLETARKLTGVTPVIILTHKSRGQSKERSFFEDLGIAPQNIYTIENYTKEDHQKLREKDEQILKILLHIIEDVKFAMRYNRDAKAEKKQRLTFVLNHLSKMKIEKERERLLYETRPPKPEKTSARSRDGCIVS